MQLSLSPVGNYFLVALLAVLLAALLAVGPARDKLTPGRRRVLLFIRAGVILLLVLAMLRPTLVHTETTRQSATVIFLADRSRSMQVTDAAGKKSRWEAMTTALEDLRPDLLDLQREFEVKLYTFDAETEPLALDDEPLELKAPPEGQQTAIGAALEDVLRHEAGKRLAAVVLLGDGAQRSLGPRDTPPQVPARRLADLGYPLYTVPLGQARGAGQARDLAIDELLVPPEVFVKNQLTIAGKMRVEGFTNQSLLVQLLFENSPGNMQPVAAVHVQPRAGGERVPIDLGFVPQVAGEFKVSLATPNLPGEVITSNNAMSTFVTVRKGGLGVLYLEGVSRVEQKFIRRSLDPSPDIRVDYVRLSAEKKETRPTDLAERFKPGKYDVYILGDIDAQAFTPAELTALATAVERGAGLMMLGGLHSFGAGGYGRTPLADVLPIRIDRFERQNFGEAVRPDLHLPGSVHMLPTPLGRLQSLLQIAPADKLESAWASLPPLDGANRFVGLKPGAQVLAAGDRGEPLLVAKDFGRGRTLAFAGDSTWHWWLRGFQDLHRRFWRQTILWLARKDETHEGNVWVALDRRRYAPGERVEFTAGAKAADGTPITDAAITAEVLLPSGQTAPARLLRGADTTNGTFLDATAAGDYTVRVQARRGGQVLGSAQSRFLVYDQDMELQNPAADRGAMEKLAAMTGGRTLAPEQLPELVEELRKAGSKFEVETQVKRTLWDNWPFFLMFIALLSLEWFLRKRWGLV